ncbi:MAG: DUF2169 domain-containing protein [Polyangiaceae bacterium]|nr:DUF2169 domain-containing protein [Polyangiaceae bacterium]
MLCKATFELHPKECVLAPRQEEPLGVDVYGNNDSTRSIVVPSDRAPYKPRADVVLVGHAYAPKQQPARSVMTRLLVGEIDKSIEVWCERRVRRHGQQVFEGPRLARMPLTWEHAAGGPETNNPVGLRFDAAPDQYGMVAIPNLQPPDVYVVQWGDTFEPTGYGPIAPWWPSRMRRLYQHGSRFAVQGWEKQPLPQDFDYGYFNVAPPDQQVEEVRANERVVMENMHPQHERLVTNLPGIRPRAVADRATGEREEIALVADTLWIDTDRGICTVVWRGRMGLRHPQEAGRVTFWADGLLRSSGVGTVPEHSPFNLMQGPEDEREIATLTLTPFGDTENRPTLPFEKGAPPPSVIVGIASETPSPLSKWVESTAARDDGTATLVAPFVEPAKDPLPFARDEPPPHPVSVSGYADFSTELVGSHKPFQGTTRVTAATAESFPPQNVAPPPMLGPLAAPELLARAASNLEEPDKNYVGTQVPVLKGTATPVEEKTITSDFSLERCGTLTAYIARRKSEKAAILKREGLSLESWSSIEKHWAKAIQDEMKDGQNLLLDRFDTAYVAQLEKDRGELEPRDYAGLMVAAERGTTDDVLGQLGLPRGALMRLERVWIRRMINDPDLGQRVRALMDELRARRR